MTGFERKGYANRQKKASCWGRPPARQNTALTTPSETTALSKTDGRDAAVAATIFVCTTCRRKRADVPEGYDLPGQGLALALEREVASRQLTWLTVTPVACLAVCRRPCTVAFAGPGKWTHIVGDLDAEAHLGDIVSAAVAFARTPDGIVPWPEQPQAIRRGGVARVPPLGWKPGPE